MAVEAQRLARENFFSALGTEGEDAAEAALEAATEALQEAAKVVEAVSTKITLSTDAVCEAASVEQLPEYSPSDDESQLELLTACGHLHVLLQLWSQGGCQPVSFGELRTHCLAGAQTCQLVKNILGAQLWDGWFHMVGDEPADEQPVPRQALTFVSHGLNKLKAKKEEQETKDSAANSYALMTAASKKRRAVPSAK